MIRTYSELIRFPTFVERFNYLRLHGKVGADIFGFDRVFNQDFYASREWKQIRNHVISRDLGCDLGIEDREIVGHIYVHHMNPISLDDINNATEFLLNPEFLICTSRITHEAIHYGDENLLISDPIERTRNDTCPWKSKEANYG